MRKLWPLLLVACTHAQPPPAPVADPAAAAGPARPALPASDEGIDAEPADAGDAAAPDAGPVRPDAGTRPSPRASLSPAP